MTKKVKPLHLQKQKSQTSNEFSTFGHKMSSDAWYSELAEDDDATVPSSWAYLKKELIAFHDNAKVITLKTLVEFWNNADKLNSIGATLSFREATALLAMARTAVRSFRDFYGAKVMILGAGVLLQTKVTNLSDILVFVAENDCNTASFGDRLAETLPFCSNAYHATKSPDSMKKYLEELSIEQLKSELASAEPLVDIVFNYGAIERKVQGINSLISLSTVLSKYGEIPKISGVRVKLNGTRLFLSNSGKKSLSDLSIASNNVIEIEDIYAAAPSNCTINATLNGDLINGHSRSKRARRKGKNRGRGGKK